jgi:hypothetical protein
LNTGAAVLNLGLAPVWIGEGASIFTSIIIFSAFFSYFLSFQCNVNMLLNEDHDNKAPSLHPSAHRNFNFLLFPE